MEEKELIVDCFAHIFVINPELIPTSGDPIIPQIKYVGSEDLLRGYLVPDGGYTFFGPTIGGTSQPYKAQYQSIPAGNLIAAEIRITSASIQIQTNIALNDNPTIRRFLRPPGATGTSGYYIGLPNQEEPNLTTYPFLINEYWERNEDTERYDKVRSFLYFRGAPEAQIPDTLKTFKPTQLSINIARRFGDGAQYVCDNTKAFGFYWASKRSNPAFIYDPEDI